MLSEGETPEIKHLNLDKCNTPPGVDKPPGCPSPEAMNSPRAPANPYGRGCSSTHRCRRD